MEVELHNRSLIVDLRLLYKQLVRETTPRADLWGRM